MTAYYNEIDPFAADWLENLILVGAIAPGVVDRRSIEDVTPADLAGFTQCHFFAGIGVWSYALRQAGWSDDRPVWTASCPCQPFSSAGKGGGFDDERHLWPAFHHLAAVCGPRVILGEQVASKDGLAWLDLVQSDMEATGYAFGALDLCAAGVGAPHIRQRSFWMAYALRGRTGDDTRNGLGAQTAIDRSDRDLSRERLRLGVEGASSGLDDDDARPQGHAGHDGATSGRQEPGRSVAATSVSSGMADGATGGWREECKDARRELIGNRAEGITTGFGPSGGDSRPSPTNGFWRDADWLGCRDGKWRPVEPGTFPLAHGVAHRVGTLRGYGNAINGPLATEFIEAVKAYLD